MLPNTFIETLVYKLYHLTLYMYSITQSSGSSCHSSVRKSDQCPILDQLHAHIFTAMYLHYSYWEWILKQHLVSVLRVKLVIFSLLDTQCLHNV